MANFPPNLEDGEKWLPSDIYEEIISNKSYSEALVGNISKESVTSVLDEPRKTTFESSTNGFLGANRVSVDYNPLAFQAASGSFSSYNPMAPVQSQVESFEHGGTRVLKKQKNNFWPVHVNGKEVKGFFGSTGTGVFLPRVTTTYVKEYKSIRGTGVFLQPSAIDASTANFKKKESGKNGQGTENIYVIKKERIVSTFN